MGFEGGYDTPLINMAVLNVLDRLHLLRDVIDRVRKLGDRAAYLKQRMRDKLSRHKHGISRAGADMTETRDWKWRYK